ncbi:RodZ domain-containing protein [Kangiella aquimarina]|uniref:DUF4115 domain-containing protein n=1 Tax=Kangiella aquimarina TaxID=261965 RepID=A0ABZ0X6Y9_9GAMM|nr:RodZ domain-containing protein [Kangiella aquimarina]WQG86372.1 DUF4115 domain-containing protein [Kangiella aquimarina]
MSESEQTPENDIQFSPGSLLKQAREAAGISIEEVIQQLKLTRQTVLAIESDDYSSDLPATFYRGYLRNYAELLKLDDNDIVENFDNFCKRNNLFVKAEQSLATIELEKPINSSNWLVKIFTALIVLILLLGAYYLLVEKKVWQQLTSSLNSSEGQVESISDSPNSELLLPISENSSGSADDSLQTVGEQTSEQTNAQEDQRVSLSESELSSESLNLQGDASNEALAEESAQPESVASNGELVLVFSDDCWVRITDANGKVLALGIKKGGTSMTLSGPTPYELTLGKPSAVQLSYQNEPIDLSSYPDTRAARLTLGN